MSARAGVVVTGTEVLTGRVTDRNGPWLAEQLRRHGVDIGQVVVVGDRPDDLAAALRFLQNAGVDLIITSGGLGPTADDLTAEVVAEVLARPLELDPALHARIGDIIERLNRARGRQTEPSAAAGTRKQAMVPQGAAVLEPVGTAPGLVVPAAAGVAGAPVVVLPGPPYELQAMWPAALAQPMVQQALAGREELRQHTLRLWGTSESELAGLMREQAEKLAGLEITTCLRDGELEVVSRFHPVAQQRYDDFAAMIVSTYGDAVFSVDGGTLEEIVGRLLTEQGLTIGTAESCTAGLLAARLADVPGSSSYLQGGVVSYANEVKHSLLDVPVGLLETVGAVSAEVAEAMARGVIARLGTDLGVGITGIAGPGGACPGKPVGLVELCVLGRGSRLARRVQLPGDRADVRRRSVAVALHLIWRLLTEAERSPS
ncbi:competence/damage-inducible protein A [Jatrophihabitans telluris]|uniref:CinA-like protein n=1 Tax=Jatrophihabitans telluris TaxID=2038343 RepID=A0ABY4QW66_9ACTN|nr:competence/damage-inducible protein A [Jatrophihabitans telluris]UQX87568.1 competence/damage-inducible protein A [Jatrophihabitans telluris]